MSKTKYQAQYGECTLCGKLGLLDYHHIIPKSMKVETSRKPTLVYGNEGNNVTFVNNIGKNVRIENIMIRICKECHKKLHREFKKYRETKS